MSARSRDLPRRSCLSTPGSNEKFLAKAPTVPADMTFLDLEDAVAPLEKESARPKVVDAIKNLPWDDRVLCVRVNAWDTEWTYGDVIEVVGNAGERLDEIMLPKVQSAAEVVALDLLLTQVEKKSGLPVGHIGIEAQIETARVASSTSTRSAPPRPASRRSSSARPTSPPASRCRCSPAGSTIPEYPGDHFNYVFSRILMAGRANGLQVIDGPFLKVRELDALRDYSHAHPDARLRREVGAHARPGRRAQRGLLADPGAVRPGLRHPRRLPARPPRTTARARSCSATR